MESTESEYKQTQIFGQQEIPLLFVKTSTSQNFKADRLNPELLERYHPDSKITQPLFRFDSHDRQTIKTSTYDQTDLSLTYSYDKILGFHLSNSYPIFNINQDLTIQSYRTDCWISARDQPLIISNQDIIRLGSLQLKVVQKLTPEISGKIKSTNLNDDNFCTICCNKTSNNHLVRACICNGKTQFKHIQCLTKQMVKSVKVKGQIISIQLDNRECNTCKSKYNVYFIDEAMELVNSVFDSVISGWMEKTQFLLTDEQNFYFIQSGFSEITLGRSPDCDIELLDASISRNHAYLRQNDINQVTIEDNISKYGTFLQVKTQIDLKESPCPITLVKDNHMIQFKILS